MEYYQEGLGCCFTNSMSVRLFQSKTQPVAICRQDHDQNARNSQGNISHEPPSLMRLILRGKLISRPLEYNTCPPFEK